MNLTKREFMQVLGAASVAGMGRWLCDPRPVDAGAAVTDANGANRD